MDYFQKCCIYANYNVTLDRFLQCYTLIHANSIIPMNDNISVISNSLLYILQKFEDATIGKHKLFKILYFAEQKHLAKYGKSITEDTYIAMPYGPVPSLALDIVNYEDNNAFPNPEMQEAKSMLEVNDKFVTALSPPDLEWLSVSEIKCIDESFDENCNLTFGQLTDKSHDSAWNEASRLMDKLKIAKAGGANDGVLNYMSYKEELKNLRF